MPRLVQTLPDGPLDIIGDVHGEIDALRRLLWRLGCDPEAGSVQRPLVFVGDLVDRGPDSPAVVRLVQRLVEAGVAWCVAGNHELNLLRADHKEGNGWFFGHNDGYHRKEAGGTRHRPFDSVELTDPSERESLRAFLATLPVALVRDDLRVVHACWDDEALSALPEAAELATLADRFEEDLLRELESSGVLVQAERERRQFADLRDPDVKPDRMLPAAQALAEAEQLGNPLRVLTSGREEAIGLADIFFVGGKWRLVTRSAWWERYDAGPAVVVGHYWRRRGEADREKADLWDKVDRYGWAGPRGNVFCVDYSVGRRFAERWRRPQTGDGGFDGGLAALRWPERVLVFDDRSEPTPTTGFGVA